MLWREGQKLGHGIVESFDPDLGWFSISVVPAKMVFLPWEFWRYGDEPAHHRKPANPWFGTNCIGYVAIADGMLSADVSQVKLAWTCWPGKESAIFRFDIDQHHLG